MTHSCRTEMLEGKQIFTLFGKLRTGTTSFILNELQYCLNQKAMRYVIDLRSVTDLDCRGLGLLVTLKNSIKDSAKIVELIIEDPFIQELIMMAKLDQMFRLVTTKELPVT
ncbi:anti-anti-sigma factor [Bacillus mesophilus]|uniref:STAS domain-containing protein n=1 Tax=Bacillus mesophilus TaxID=1808955 RepID=A0A6M0Q3K6_9BACI|nr:STAS domain-containing protein [Bacillus mesophilus]MBM7660262.1 anti-anti-sigma factor [Bacillus mesophilus]NEY70977.1 STAS domain-containing protein [Bacillus mesophilus]